MVMHPWNIQLARGDWLKWIFILVFFNYILPIVVNV